MNDTELSGIRELVCKREHEILSPYACFADESRGRRRKEEPCPVRTAFQQDRDRIIHCKTFRRLMHKTQVFLSPDGDHYRTRLTHTLEVMQIARTIARGLRLNEDLVEAISMGHDLGHTPFGHAGEYALQECYSPNFRHYKQSARVVEKLERDGRGLNLTREVVYGILHHSDKYGAVSAEKIKNEVIPGQLHAPTLEADIVKFADRIAYTNHDIDDACRAGILRPEDIPGELRRTLGETHSDRITTMVMSIIKYSSGKNLVDMDDEIREATTALHRFLTENVYLNPKAKGEEAKAKELLKTLYYYYIKNPEKMGVPLDGGESVKRLVADFISGMTDRYAIKTFNDLFVPKVWSIG